MKLGALWLAWIAAGIGLLAGESGCSVLNTCDMSNEDAQPYTSGATADGHYMSSPWDGPLLSFPAGKRYDLMHGLGCTPADVHIWVSFGENGASDGSNAAPCAGNMCTMELIDDQKIRIKNDTCSDFYLLVTASGCEPGDGGASDGASDAGEEDGM